MIKKPEPDIEECKEFKILKENEMIFSFYLKKEITIQPKPPNISSIPFIYREIVQTDLKMQC